MRVTCLRALEDAACFSHSHDGVDEEGGDHGAGEVTKIVVVRSAAPIRMEIQ